ncbi:MAG: hypothetical protein QGG40_13610, partial [Myxococcota bacterium]|nr:hypothetical protein [Myxococcota bacterium]
MARLVVWFSVAVILSACSGKGEETTNAGPSAQITSHDAGAEVLEGYTESFQGVVSDADHDVSELLTYWYSGSAMVCSGASPDSAGVSTCDIVITTDSTKVTLEVKDPKHAVDSAEVSLSVYATEAPVAEISAPTGEDVYYADYAMDLEGLVSDAEDAVADLVVSWTSDLDGDLEVDVDADGVVTGSVTLSEGNHTLELDV